MIVTSVRRTRTLWLLIQVVEKIFFRSLLGRDVFQRISSVPLVFCQLSSRNSRAVRCKIVIFSKTYASMCKSHSRIYPEFEFPQQQSRLKLIHTPKKNYSAVTDKIGIATRYDVTYSATTLIVFAPDTLRVAATCALQCSERASTVK